MIDLVWCGVHSPGSGDEGAFNFLAPPADDAAFDDPTGWDFLFVHIWESWWILVGLHNNGWRMQGTFGKNQIEYGFRGCAFCEYLGPMSACVRYSSDTQKTGLAG